MAITRKKTSVRAVAKFQSGLSDLGEPILKSKVISGVATDSADADIFALVETVASLQDLALAEVESREYVTLTQ